MNGTEQRKRVGTPVDRDSKRSRQLSPSEVDEALEADADLETFRKEAIWREMKEYRRKLERSERRVSELEQSMVDCEARLSAVDISWKQLVLDATRLLPSTSTGSVPPPLQPVTSRGLTEDALQAALDQRTTATRELLSRLGGLLVDSTASPDAASLHAKCQELALESQQFQEALRLLKLSHDDLGLQLERCRAALARAEKRLDRSRSRSVARLLGNDAADSSQAQSPSVDSFASPHVDKSIEEGSAGQAISESMMKSATHEGTPTMSLHAAAQQLQTSLALKDKEIGSLRSDRSSLQQQLAAVRLSLAGLTEEALSESSAVKALQEHIDQLQEQSDTWKLEREALRKECDELREQQRQYKADIVKQAEASVNETEKRLEARETDLARVRIQRDELRAEASGLRAKEAEAIANIEDLRTVMATRQQRLDLYASEVKRLRVHIASLQGDEAAVAVYTVGDPDSELAENRRRLAKAEDLLLALRDQLQAYAQRSEAPNAQALVDSETEARRRVAQLEGELARAQSLIKEGEGAQDGALLSELDGHRKRVKELQLLNTSLEQSSSSLYSELDRLSGAWEELDRKTSAKVLDVLGYEDKLARLAAEKSKADNRYFSVMRQKDAVAAENAVLAKLSEQQQRAVQSATDAQVSLNAQIAALEREITGLQSSLRACQDVLAQQLRDNNELKAKAEQANLQLGELNDILRQRTKALEAESAARLAAQEDAAKATQLVDSLPSNAAEATEEVKRENEDLTKMLKCSTCAIRFKAVIINRCGHLFCRECIDARLANRQRKCPSCAIAFGKDDVFPVYF